MVKVTKVPTDNGHAYVIGPEDIVFGCVGAAEPYNSKNDRESGVGYRDGIVIPRGYQWRKGKVVPRNGKGREKS